MHEQTNVYSHVNQVHTEKRAEHSSNVAKRFARLVWTRDYRGVLKGVARKGFPTLFQPMENTDGAMY